MSQSGSIIRNIKINLIGIIGLRKLLGLQERIALFQLKFRRNNFIRSFGATLLKKPKGSGRIPVTEQHARKG